MVMKIVGASLAFAAFVCLLIGGWHDLSVGCLRDEKRLTQRFGSEYDDYADDELYGLRILKSGPGLPGPLFCSLYKNSRIDHPDCVLNN